MAQDLGNGASIAFGTSAYSFGWESIDLGEEVRAMIPKSKLSTTGAMEKLASDIYDAGELRVRGQMEPTLAKPVTKQAAETVTVTFPISVSGNTTNATFAGTGNISRVKNVTLENDTLQTFEITVTWDGNTDPAFTVESA